MTFLAYSIGPGINKDFLDVHEISIIMELMSKNRKKHKMVQMAQLN